MRMERLAKFILRNFVPSVACRPPNVVIGESHDPYLLRWYLVPRNRLANVYLHRFLRSDDPRALHDHPYANASFILDGAYTEHTIQDGGVHNRAIRPTGAVKLRGATQAHRIELHQGPCWTIFLTGPRTRQWGWHCKHGWRHWKDFTSGNGTTIGKGCD